MLHFIDSPVEQAKLEKIARGDFSLPQASVNFEPSYHQVCNLLFLMYIIQK